MTRMPTLTPSLIDGLVKGSLNAPPDARAFGPTTAERQEDMEYMRWIPPKRLSEANARFLSGVCHRGCTEVGRGTQCRD